MWCGVGDFLTFYKVGIFHVSTELRIQGSKQENSQTSTNIIAALFSVTEIHFFYIHLVVSKTHRVSIKYIQVLKNFFPPRSDLQ